MKSPAQAHLERVSAATAAASETRADARCYALMLAKLATDRRRLKSIQSLERKIAVKRELLPDYADYVTGALEGGCGAQDDVLVTVMVWRIDGGDFVGALDIAAYALRYGLTLPAHYARTVATLVTEEIAEAALMAFAARTDFSAAVLTQLAELTEKHDMPDPVRAKLHKAFGLALQVNDPDSALPHLRRALALHERCGVKKDIERLERARTQTTADEAAAENTSPPSRAARAHDPLQ